MKRVAIVGAGLSGLVAAWQMTRPAVGDAAVEVTLFEASDRAGGIVQTVCADGFVVELGPDSWVTEKPAAIELVRALGLEHEVIVSNDATRRTYLLRGRRLEAMPDHLRLMVPVGDKGLASVEGSALFSVESRAAFRREVTRAAELQRAAPIDDESIASFVRRHFGEEVLDSLAAPLLAGVFGGDVERLSVRAVMAPMVAMERQTGSLVAALEEREAERRATGRAETPIFSTLRRGLGSLVEALVAALPAGCLRLSAEVTAVRRRAEGGWLVRGRQGGRETETAFDAVVLAAPAAATAGLLEQVDAETARLLPTEASSAVLVALGWTEAEIAVPAGFGFLVPPPRAGERGESRLLAGTFADQKFPGRVPSGGRLLRVFFGGEQAEALLRGHLADSELVALAMAELRPILGPLPEPSRADVSRWPRSLPQYAVGHLERVSRMEKRLAELPGLHVLGNALRGVGLPDVIARARAVGDAVRVKS